MPYSPGGGPAGPTFNPQALKLPLLKIHQRLHMLRYTWKREPAQLRKVLGEDYRREYRAYKRSFRHKRPRPRAAERNKLYDEWLFNELKQRQEAMKQLQKLGIQILKALSEVEDAIAQLEAQLGKRASMVASATKQAAQLRKEVETEAKLPAQHPFMRFFKTLERRIEYRRRKTYPRAIYKKRYNPRGSSSGHKRRSSSSSSGRSSS